MAAIVRVARPSRRLRCADKRLLRRWQGPLSYRTLKEFYLLASDWLLRQASEAET